jgi:hypothetical protein
MHEVGKSALKERERERERVRANLAFLGWRSIGGKGHSILHENEREACIFSVYILDG